MIADRRCTDHLHPFFVKLLRIKLNVVRYDNQSAILTDERIQPQSPHSARYHQSDIAVNNAVSFGGFFNCTDKFVFTHRHHKADSLRRFIKPFYMRFQLKYPAVINTNTLKNTVAVKKTVVENRYLGIRLVNKFVIKPNF